MNYDWLLALHTFWIRNSNCDSSSFLGPGPGPGLTLLTFDLSVFFYLAIEKSIKRPTRGADGVFRQILLSTVGYIDI